MIELPTLTETHITPDTFRPIANSLYVCGNSSEARSAHYSTWSENASEVHVCKIYDEQKEQIRFRFSDGEDSTLSLRSQAKLRAFWQSSQEVNIYIDITGLLHSTWSALLRGLINDMRRIFVVYVEPEIYRTSSSPSDSEVYDLSESIEGISPLPGFERFRRDSSKGLFLPILGFEGPRLQFLLNHIEPIGHNIYPIIGAPGFRAEYPFHAYYANRRSLLDSHAWKRVYFATASCPFSTFNIISRIREANSEKFATIAPIGTKPQSLAAIVYAIQNPDSTEIVYDHPRRKPHRTEGQSRLHIYNITGLLLKNE
ncbi:MAG: hypothetical protein R3C11_21980 [Planctomycetaceae bacterium]